MENMGWIGLVALGVLLCYSSYPGRVKKLEKKMNKLNSRQGEKRDMSKMIAELVGKSCKIKFSAEGLDFSAAEISGQVLDVDDEWMKILYTDKKKGETTKILRIENIAEIDIL